MTSRIKQRIKKALTSKHSGHWATCKHCETRTRQLEHEGLTRSDAQGVAEAEHMKEVKE